MNMYLTPNWRRLTLIITLCTPLSIFAQKELKKTFDGVKRIQMTTASGSCTFVKSNSATVVVQVKYTYDESKYEPTLSLDGDKLVIREHFHGRSAQGESDWKLTVPDNLGIEFTTGSGQIEAAQLMLDLKATTGSGNLIFTGITGTLSGTTGSGNVTLKDVDAKIRAVAGSGNFQVSNSAGELSITSGSGNLRLENSKGTFKATTGSGHITGSDLTISGPSNFATGSGDASIALAATPLHNIDIASGSGDAKLDFDGHDIKGEIVMKANKKNGDIIAPFSFDKVEEISEGGNQITVKKTVVMGDATPQIRISTGSGDATIKK